MARSILSRRYLLWFAQEHVDFRWAEVDSIISALDLSFEWIDKSAEKPYWVVESVGEAQVKLLASRSVSLRFCQEIWAHSNSINDLHAKLKALPAEFFQPHFADDKSFKVDVETYNRHFTQEEKVNKIDTFSYLPIKGPIRLKDPDMCLQYVEYYGIDPMECPQEPVAVFFGRWVANGLRQLIKKISLKTRKFIGNTSMDPQLSLLMANQAKVLPGHLVLDPFVGSGSLLVAAAYFGGFVMGTDIDYLMLHAKTRPSRIRQKERERDESVCANMHQYGLSHCYLDVLVNDFAVPIFKSDMEFDSIITDPPYGIRESTERIGINKEHYEISENHLATHIPCKVEYGLAEIYRDLLAFSAIHLKLHGRLVCWFPVFREDYSAESLPKHPCLKLIANSEQVLSKFTSRRLLTYEKTSHLRECLAAGDGDCHIPDFRDKYFKLREESRSERRLKNAQRREQDRLRHLEASV